MNKAILTAINNHGGRFLAVSRNLFGSCRVAESDRANLELSASVIILSVFKCDDHGVSSKRRENEQGNN